MWSPMPVFGALVAALVLARGILPASDLGWLPASGVAIVRSADASLALQQHGIGTGRRFGCGLFVPHKSAAAVGAPD